MQKYIRGREMYVDVLYYICKNKCNSYRPICTVLVFLLRLCKTIKNISFGGGGGVEPS
jgi:hypothetical protein